MVYKNEDAFAKAFKAGTRHSAYLFYGQQNYLIEKWAASVCAQSGEGAFNLHRFDGRRLDVDSLYEAVEALPLMAQQRCAHIDDLDWKGLSAADQAKLAEILGDLPGDCILVATAKAPAFDPKLAGSKKLITLFDKAGCAVELGTRDAAGQAAFLKSEAKRRGCAISTELCRYLLESCESDMLVLQNEIAKVCANAGSGEITRAQIDAVIIPKTEAKVFDLSKAILAGNTARAMEMLDDLFYLRESAVMILAVLIRAFVDLYRARIARDEGRSSSEVVSMFGYKGREFVVRNAFSATAGLSTTYLRGSLDVLHRCDSQLKSSPVQERVLLEQAVMELFLLRS